MNRHRAWLGSVCLAGLLAACTSAQPATPTPGAAGSGQGQAGNSGAAGNAGTGGSVGCPSNQKTCGGSCVDVSSDMNNCGDCGIPCGGGRTCQSSQCLCPSGLLDCGACVPSDATNCGSCGNACTGNRVCSGTTCSSSCASGTTPCGTACCISSQTCTNGACVDNGAGGTGGMGGTTGSGGSAAGTAGSSGASGTAGRGGTTGTGGRGGSGGTTGAGGSGGSSTAGTGGTAPPSPILYTSAQNAYWRTGTLTTVTSAADMTVNDATTYQTWDGFGGAFNEMGWDDLMQLSQSDRDRAMQLLFDGTDGAHFVFGRIPIGANDYALTRYTEDETAGDTSMANFSIARDMMYLIPFVRAALALNPNLRLWASPWTPPTWMKTTSGTVSGASCALTGSSMFDGGCMADNNTNLQALALYLVKFVQAYQAQGIKIEAIHHQNEPGYATGYPSCLWTPALYSKFIGQYLGPTFASMNIGAQIYLGTMSNNDANKDGTIVTTVNADTGTNGAFKYIKGYGLQWNMRPVISSLTSKGLPIMQTEHQCGNYPWGGETTPFNMTMAPNDYNYGVETWGLIKGWITDGVNSYSSWNMVLDTVGTGIPSGRLWPQNALLVVNRSAKTLTATPAYYVFRHFSQYVLPGAKRVAVTGTSVDAVAFKNMDGSIVAAMYNSGSAAKTTTFSIGGARLQFSVPANGFATVRK